MFTTISENDYITVTNETDQDKRLLCVWQGGDLILSVICDGEIYPDLNKEGFGLKISRDNIDSFIKLIKENE